VKGFADGSLGSRTAYFFGPFSDTPENRGLLSSEMQPPAAMRDRMLKADSAGIELCTLRATRSDRVHAAVPCDRRWPPGRRTDRPRPRRPHLRLPHLP
jgi:hypothetical protein